MILTPKKYFNILHSVFFRIISFEKEVETCNKKKRLSILLQSSVYNFVLSVLVVVLVLYMLSYFGLLKIGILDTWEYIAFGIAFGIALGIALGIADGIAWGIAWGIALGIVLGIVWGIEWGIALVIADGIALGIVVGIVVGIALGISWGIAGVIAVGIVFGITIDIALGIALGISFGIRGGISFGISFILFYYLSITRLFYLPRLLFSPPPNKNPLIKDENIAIFPFLPKILLIYYDKKSKDYALEITLLLINNRKRYLREQAQKGLSLITYKVLYNFNDVKDIQDIDKHINYLPKKEDLPEDLSSLSYFRSISNDIKIAKESHNLSNKVDIYKNIQANLAEKAKSNSWNKEKNIGEIIKVTNKWQQIVTKAIAEIENSNKTLPLPNPFTVGKPVKGEAFVGRIDIIEEIKHEALRESGLGGILFKGSRRTGKTSTLVNLSAKLTNDLLYVYLDAQSPMVVSNVAKFCSTMAKEVTKIVEIKPNSPIKDLSELTEYFEEVQNYISERRLRLLIAIDEFEEFTEKILKGRFTDLPTTLRYWIQHLDNFVFLFAGSNELYNRTDFDWSNYLINLRTVKISYLDKKSAKQLMTKPISSFNLQYETPELLEWFVNHTGGQPYVIQALMYELVEILNKDGNRKTATKADIDLAIEKAFAAIESYINHFWKFELSAEMRSELLNLIQGKELTDKKAVKMLMQKDFIYKNGTAYEFCVPFIRQWIEENHIF